MKQAPSHVDVCLVAPGCPGPASDRCGAVRPAGTAGRYQLRVPRVAICARQFMQAHGLGHVRFEFHGTMFRRVCREHTVQRPLAYRASFCVRQIGDCRTSAALEAGRISTYGSKKSSSPPMHR